MPHTRPRSLRRNLLAVCTFLVPLGVLAWLGKDELQRQALQARSALDREALQFLRAAASSLEQRLDQELPAVAERSAGLLARYSPARATRELRAARFGAVLDIVQFGGNAQLVHPGPTGSDPGLPMHRDPPSREPNPLVDALHLADLLLPQGRFDDARRHLQAAVDTIDWTRRRRLESFGLEVEALFRLATVQQRLGDRATARATFEQVIDQVQRLLRNTRNRSYFASALALGLYAEVALAEAETDPGRRVDLLAQLVDGERDHVNNAVLQGVAERLAGGIAESSPARPVADELLLDLSVHLRAREFAADYNRLLRETLRRRLQTSPDPPIGGDAELRQLITAGNPRSLLLLRPALPDERGEAAWIGIRLDLGELLAGALESFVRSDGTFVLAVADGDGQPIVSAPPAPESYTPPAMACYGMTLRAYPRDVERFFSDARATARASMLLLFGLLVVATIGALWLWRSVSRESELLALKVDLVSRVSHELKTPLALISLYGETLGLKRAKDADQAAKFGGIIARESARLTTMIQRILDFSRQEAGTLHYSKEPTDLSIAVEEIVLAYEPHLESKGATVTLELGQGIVADVDKAALGGVLVNLLENAVKYVDEERPDRSLRVELRRAGDHAILEVHDRGRGVPPKEHEQIFDSFYRASNSGEVRGAGLGLSLVRHFAEAHDGSATAMPRHGGGSIFRIAIRLHQATITDPDGPKRS